MGETGNLRVKQEIGFTVIIDSYTVGACVGESDYVEEDDYYVSKIRESARHAKSKNGG